MLYGATGYTGALTARLAAELEIRLVLAGRHAGRVQSLAQTLGMDARVFGLDDPNEVRTGLKGIDAVLHMAGPFSGTSSQMVSACIDEGVHYLDITGEIQVFESVLGKDAEAKKAGVVLIPGVGFDVLPTDCLSAMLSQKMPDATSLELAIYSKGQMSRGTLKTSIEGLHMGGWVRRNGSLTPVQLGTPQRPVEFSKKTLLCTAVPWGDLSTAHHTTGIPNITTYFALPKQQQRLLGLIHMFRGVLKMRFLRRLMQGVVQRSVYGPTDAERAAGSCEIWGEVRNEKGECCQGMLTTSEGYTLTAHGALHAAKRLLASEIKPGAWTPAKYFGPDFIRDIKGVSVGKIL